MSGLSLTPERAGQMIHHLEERLQAVEALLADRARNDLDFFATWRRTQARINAEVFQEIQDVKQIISVSVRVPTETN